MKPRARSGIFFHPTKSAVSDAMRGFSIISRVSPYPSHSAECVRNAGLDPPRLVLVRAANARCNRHPLPAFIAPRPFLLAPELALYVPGFAASASPETETSAIASAGK